MKAKMDGSAGERNGARSLVDERFAGEFIDSLRTTGMLTTAETVRFGAERAARLADYLRRCGSADLPLPRSPRLRSSFTLAAA